MARTPIPIQRGLRELGDNLNKARRRRRISTTLMAERAQISRTTLTRIEVGDPGVSMANYASIIFVLGFLEDLTAIGALGHDPAGPALESEQLPERIRSTNRF